ncbi:MAG: ATP-binding protein [Calditrichaeota bacterium]|nr:MAG: ATP-binding protein [Calditrichota bacterium]
MKYLKSYRSQLILRFLLLFFSMFTMSYFIVAKMIPMLTVLVGLLILWQVVSLFRVMEQTNRELARFIEATQNADFTQTFSRKYSNKSYAALHKTLVDIMAKFKNLRTEKEAQYRYLQTVIQHLGIGILAFANDGAIELINKAAKRLLNLTHLRHLHSLKDSHFDFYETLQHIKRGEKRLVKFTYNDNVSQIIVHATDFIIAGKALKLVTLQDIQGELDEKEMEAWQNLIRVLTHEIMNSITPISSLAATASSLVSSESKTTIPADHIEDVQQALVTIQKRSDALMNFVDKYRSLTRIPRPQFQIIPVATLFNEIENLYNDAFATENINLITRIEPSRLEVTADPELVEQVLINLTVNARQAVLGRAKAQVELYGFLGDRGHVIIEVSDNGSGIDGENLEKIFIPFFTTKKTGSGIGLSLCRQIMRLHGGAVSVHSEPNIRTTFRLRF